MRDLERVALLGASGFIGGGLPRLLASRGVAVTGFSRSPGTTVEGVDRWQDLENLDFSGCQAVINLAGAPIDTRWTEAARRRFRESRVGLTGRVVEALGRLPQDERPRVLINASAVGVYGDRGDEILKESASAGEGFLAGLCRDWEAAAMQAGALGVRVVTLRTGIVLGRGHGALKKMLPVFRSGLGGRLGKGRQWMPWIHIADQRQAMLHALFCETLRGPLNLSAPVPERNEAFTRELAAALGRPAFLQVPGLALKLAFGEFATALLGSQRAVPAALRASGFEFRFPTLDAALVDLV